MRLNKISDFNNIKKSKFQWYREYDYPHCINEYRISLQSDYKNIKSRSYFDRSYSYYTISEEIKPLSTNSLKSYSYDTNAKRISDYESIEILCSSVKPNFGSFQDNFKNLFKIRNIMRCL